ncbi:MAG: nucleotide exchange factor GrpE [Candidatus Micrarchaeaceae archaeon]
MWPTAENKDSKQDLKNEHEAVSEEEKASDGDDCEDLKERFLRLAAEFDNYKKRVRKDMDGAQEFGKAALVKDMLPIIDEFELAVLAISDVKDKNIVKGMEMLYSNFMEVLKKEGLKEIDADGKFDPYKHEIMMVKESGENDGAILEVLKKGYFFGDRLLRPASVIVSKNKENADSEEKL